MQKKCNVLCFPIINISFVKSPLFVDEGPLVANLSLGSLSNPCASVSVSVKWGEQQHLSSRVAVGFTQVNPGKALGTMPEWVEGLWPAGPPFLLQEGFGAPRPQAPTVQGSLEKVV